MRRRRGLGRLRRRLPRQGTSAAALHLRRRRVRRRARGKVAPQARHGRSPRPPSSADRARPSLVSVARRHRPERRHLSQAAHAAVRSPPRRLRFVVPPRLLALPAPFCKARGRHRHRCRRLVVSGRPQAPGRARLLLTPRRRPLARRLAHARAVRPSAAQRQAVHRRRVAHLAVHEASHRRLEEDRNAGQPARLELHRRRRHHQAGRAETGSRKTTLTVRTTSRRHLRRPEAWPRSGGHLPQALPHLRRQGVRHRLRRQGKGRAAHRQCSLASEEGLARRGSRRRRLGGAHPGG